MASNGIHEIPTKDTEGSTTHAATGEVYTSFSLIYTQVANFLKCILWQKILSHYTTYTLI